MHAVRKLELSKGRGGQIYALVDPWIYPDLMQYRWTAFRNGKGLYAVRGLPSKNGSSRQTIYLHRELMCAPVGMPVDHINGNTLDNRISNLRVCTYAQNNRNVIKRSTGSNTYKGVTFQPKRKLWTANIRVDGVSHHLGSFRSERDAAIAYDAGALTLHGEFARLNLPKEKTVAMSIEVIKELAKKPNKIGESGYRGVYRDGKKWRANFFEPPDGRPAGKRRINIGNYGTAEEARDAYIQFVKNNRSRSAGA